MNIIEVKVPALEQPGYRVTIGTSLLETIIPSVNRTWPANKVYVITDSALVATGHFDKLTASQQIAGKFVIDPAGEVSKHMAMITAILEDMESCKLGRDTTVIALGGGVVGDMAGFAASIFKRGVPVIQVPTTTVSQADSAIGGKTGVDSSKSKNAFGTFWHPAVVYVDVSVLHSLDDRQYRAGLLESVKHALILDADYFSYLESNLNKILQRDETVLAELARKNCQIKASVVQKDPYEKNLRKILNYGHTIGHAVESASDYQLLHGECVAIGIIAANLIESEMGLTKDDRLARIKALLEKLGQPTKIPATVDKSQVLSLLALDKKAQAQSPRFILLDRIGSVFTQNGNFAVPVDDRIIKTVLDRL